MSVKKNVKSVKKKKKLTMPKCDNRLLFTSSVIGCLLIIFVVKLFYIMIIKHEEYSQMAQGQRERTESVKASRGSILASNGQVLATNVEVYRVDLDLASIRTHCEEKEVTIEQVGKSLSEALEMSYDDIMAKLNLKKPNGSPATYATLIRGIHKDKADKTKGLKIHGVIVGNDTIRVYPGDNYLGHTLGSVNLDTVGLNGVELQYEEYLSGVPGMSISEVDGWESEIPGNKELFTPPVQGKDITLTIDENIQLIVENIAEQALAENSAKGVSILAMNPKNGEILGMVNKPDFNPNEPFEGFEAFPGENDTEKVQNMLRNNMVSDAFEPGSTFKVFSLMAALEEGVVSENDTFNCTGGTMFGDTLVKCWKLEGHGVQTLPQILQNSCNVGFMEVGARLGKEKLTEYIHKYGFGVETGIDLPGEAAGIVKSPEGITDMDLGAISFGQTNTVTTMQLMQAFNAVANGGDIIQPHIMKEISHKEGQETEVIDNIFDPKIQRGIMSPENTAVMRDYLERTINEGKEVGHFMGPEYRVGAKTGTAEKPDLNSGGYAKDKYIASALAMYPIDDPQITIYIKVDEPNPQKYYGGQVVSPLLKVFFKEVDSYLKSDLYKTNSESKELVIVPDVRGKSVKEANKILEATGLKINLQTDSSKVKTQSPYPGALVHKESVIDVNTNVNSKSVVVPNLKGYSAEDAKKLLSSLNLKVKVEGHGTLQSQSVKAGEVVQIGTEVKLQYKE